MAATRPSFPAHAALVAGAGALGLISHGSRRAKESRGTFVALERAGYFRLADGPFLNLARTLPELRGYESFDAWKRSYVEELLKRGVAAADVPAAIRESAISLAVEAATRSARAEWVAANPGLARAAAEFGYLRYQPAEQPQSTPLSSDEPPRRA